MVIPVAARAKVGIEAGDELEVVVDDFSIRLVRTGAAPTLARRGKRLVARPAETGAPRKAIDIAALVDEERNRWPW